MTLTQQAHRILPAFIIAGAATLAMGLPGHATSLENDPAIFSPAPGRTQLQDIAQDRNGLHLIIQGRGNSVNPGTAGQNPAGTNSMDLAIVGDRNGGWGREWPHLSVALPGMASISATPLFASFPAPGTLLQTGKGHSMRINVSGNDNLFAAAQYGTGHTLSANINGANNFAATVQSGQGNMSAYTQTGTNNALAISQSSW